MISKHIRRQKHLTMADYAPNINNMCACGCGVELTGRKKRWATSDCATRCYEEFSIIKGNTSAIRKALFSYDYGYCRECGVYDSKWQADHITPVKNGGGGCNIFNFQTLCPHCHVKKTNHQRVSHLAEISSH
jgi:5-methylcytosine-specific restriction endonuclease McrA